MFHKLFIPVDSMMSYVTLSMTIVMLFSRGGGGTCTNIQCCYRLKLNATFCDIFVAAFTNESCFLVPFTYQNLGFCISSER